MRMIFAVIPAAGESTRMGKTKLALPLGNSSILTVVIATLNQAGVDHTVVVVGPHVPELIPLVKGTGADLCLLAQSTPDMRATVEHGIAWLESHYHPSAGDCWLLVPGDHPAIDPQVVRRLVESRHQNKQHSILIPSWQGKRGHPTLIDWSHVAGIRAMLPGQGINAYFRLHSDCTLEVPVESATIIEDMDTPEDYERLRRQLER
jgi:molybdenum cofactor cytidylyltransferase